ALLPLVTLLGLVLPGLLSGSVIIERIFAWPGLGRLYFDSILSRDYPVVLALSLAGAVATLGVTLAADVAYAPAAARAASEIRLESRLLPPSASHPFGTDDLGRDLLARVVAATPISLAIGMTAA